MEESRKELWISIGTQNGHASPPFPPARGGDLWSTANLNGDLRGIWAWLISCSPADSLIMKFEFNSYRREQRFKTGGEPFPTFDYF